MSTPSSEAWTLLVNVHARSGRQMLAAAEEELRKQGIAVGEVLAIHNPKKLQQTVQDAKERGMRRILVGGGDGTISCVAGVLAGSDLELGVLPMGTGNDFAKSLGLPEALPEAVAVLGSGRTIRIDVGLADNRVFLNAAGVGISAKLAKQLDPTLKRWIGKLAYPLTMLRHMKENQPFRVRLETGDTTIEVDAMQVVVGNGRYHGAGNLISPEATLTDHELHAYLIVPPGTAAPTGMTAADPSQWAQIVTLARVASKLRSGKHLEDENVLFLSAKELTLDTSPAQDVNIDGELSGKTPVRFRVKGSALSVRVPENWSAIPEETAPEASRSAPLTEPVIQSAAL